ncbi:MAG: sulfatase-like hydrolase/transferase, partial [Thermoanaerobaculia bacterium]
MAVESRAPSVRALGGGSAVAGKMLLANERRWSWSGQAARSFAWDIPRGRGQLRISCAGSAGLRVAVVSGGKKTRTAALAEGWNDVSLPVERGLFSPPVVLSLEGCGDRPCAWGDVLYRSASAAPASGGVNLLLILVDTLRADAINDRVRGALPTIDRLAAEGTLFERAYSQCSWTLPSVSSLLTGRWPADSPSWSVPTQGIPEPATPLAEILQANSGTAAFVANPLIKDDQGFGRGFDTFWGAPPEAGVFTPAEEPVSRALSWLRTHGDERFFLFLHLMDPHDPYCPPARRKGPPDTWPGQPDPAFTGKAPMPDEATLAEWRRLYAEEVAHTDSQIGLLLDGLDPEVRGRTLVVVTSDHGEEFLEHGFLKHAVTLFDEAVHVPLLVRLPGAPGGRRVADLVRLVDVVPTLADLLRAPVSAALRSRWAGVSLAEVVRGNGRVPSLLAIGETFGFGPLRWYAYDGRYKVVLFNRDHRLPAEIPALKHPNEWLRAHLPPEEVYLSTADAPTDRPTSDDREKKLVWAHNLASRYAMGKIAGLWLSFRGPGRGGRLSARVVVPPRAKTHVVPLFWRAGDRALQHGSALEIDVADDGITRLAVLVGLDDALAEGVRVVSKDAAVPVRRGRPASEEPAVRYWLEKESPHAPGAPG